MVGEHFGNYLLGNQFEILTDHKAIISALKTNRGNKTYQSRPLDGPTRFHHSNFSVNHIAGSKLGIVDYFRSPPTYFRRVFRG